jgi:superfamily II RNA helicase
MTSLLIQPDAMVAPKTWPPEKPLALTRSYEPDALQKHCILALEAGDDVFIGAPTGTGKTYGGEYLIAKALRDGGRVFYTTPIKALSNQKYKDLKKLFPGASVGLLTGDIKMQPDAQIIVMTAEILCNLLKKLGGATEGVGLTAAVSLEGVVGIVVDEAHYIQDADRGHVWEETLILAARLKKAGRFLQLVLLSATLPNAADLVGWLATLSGTRTHLLTTTYRIVPLVHGILMDGKVVPFLTNGSWNTDGYQSWLKGQKAVEDAAASHKKAVEVRKRDGYSAPPPQAKARVESPEARLKRVVAWLHDAKEMPALFFMFSRKECERLAGTVELNLLERSEVADVTHIMDFHLSRHKAVLEKSPQYHGLRDLLRRGIAFHHSGLQPVLKEIVEILFARGFVKALFATETFSVGLNMPTKTVVFFELRKVTDGGRRRLLLPAEYIQMAGRAGRRGIDVKGLVLYEPLREPVTNTELKSLLTGGLPPLNSKMRFHYDFILKQRLTDLRLAEQSYWAVQQRVAREHQRTRVAELEADVVKLQAAITEEEAIAIEAREALEFRVSQTYNAANRKARAALQEWDDEHKGAEWAFARKTYTEFKDALKAASGEKRTLAAWDAAPLLSVDPLEMCLEKWGFLTKEKALTPLGIAATEVNEGHPILMPLLAAEDKTKELSAEEVVCVLGAFIRAGGDSEEGPSLEASGLRREALDVLYWIDDTAGGLAKEEESRSIYSPESYWRLSALWVNVASMWLSGAGLTAIATTVGLFEGNVQRGLLQIANLLEEWASIATLRNDLAALEKLRTIHFLRDELIVDSLYLRL